MSAGRQTQLTGPPRRGNRSSGNPAVVVDRRSPRPTQGPFVTVEIEPSPREDLTMSKRIGFVGLGTMIAIAPTMQEVAEQADDAIVSMVRD